MLQMLACAGCVSKFRCIHHSPGARACVAMSMRVYVCAVLVMAYPPGEAAVLQMLACAGCVCTHPTYRRIMYMPETMHAEIPAFSCPHETCGARHMHTYGYTCKCAACRAVLVMALPPGGGSLGADARHSE